PLWRPLVGSIRHQHERARAIGEVHGPRSSVLARQRVPVHRADQVALHVQLHRLLAEAEPFHRPVVPEVEGLEPANFDRERRVEGEVRTWARLPQLEATAGASKIDLAIAGEVTRRYDAPVGTDVRADRQPQLADRRYVEQR